MANPRKSLETRIEILQGQIDRAVASGQTTNMLGVPMSEQINIWEKLIRKAERQIANI